MRPVAIYLLAVATLSACATGPAARAREHSPPTTTSITILSTNDLHGQLDPVGLYSAEEPPRRFRVGGAEALAATVAELRSRDPTGTLVLDAGDFMQGTLLSNAFEGRPVRDLFAMLGYDAVAIGNHEFDFGPVGADDGQKDLRGALKAWIREAPFPVLGSNIHDAQGQPLSWPNLLPFTVLTRKGIRIGIIGLTTTSTPRTTMPALVRDLLFLPLLPVVRERAGALRSAGVDLVILLAHEGGGCETGDEASCKGPLFRKLLDRLEPGLVDAVVAGHSHGCIWQRINGMLVTQACSKGVAVGRMRLVLDRASNKIDRRASKIMPPRVVCHDLFSDTLDCEGLRRKGRPRGQIIENPLLARHRRLTQRIRKKINDHRKRLGPEGNRVLSVAARPVRHRFNGVSELGTLFANALLQAVPGADAALINAAALRADLPEGPIRLAQLVDSFPFENRLATVELNGRQLEQLVSRMLKSSHGIVQVAGLRLRIHCGQSKKLLSITTEKKHPLHPHRLYTVVISDFLLTGGGGAGAVLKPVDPDRKRIFPARFIRQEVVKYLLSLSHPLNSDHRPIISRQDPPVIMDKGKCDTVDEQERSICCQR